ncbi:hypothetical protein [Ketobacter sp.]|uniref:hypothetical protein n=1 Tax=Ketobacter sp. TaxID=2083498 RepID=UPI000F1B8C22|nr:hypothetical protein [Ketobacter sp.]RLU00736.1 MAG: hypothetical protein D9N14_05615 [Ketobacter sp.]
MKITQRLTVYGAIAILALACGGASLLPSWTRPLEHPTTLLSAFDQQSLLLVENLTNGATVSVTQLDLQGNELQHHQFDIQGRQYAAEVLSPSSLLLRDRFGSSADSHILDLSTGTAEPAFSEDFRNAYPRFNYSVVGNSVAGKREQGDLILAGALYPVATETPVQAIGQWSAPGVFHYRLLPEYVASAKLTTMGNTTGYILAANFHEEYAAASAQAGFIQFLDQALNVVADIPLQQPFTLQYGFNDRAYGYFTGEDSIVFRFVDLQGQQTPRPEFLSGVSVKLGHGVFYTTKPVKGGTQYCRYDYALVLQNCFTVPAWGYVQMTQLLPDDSIGLTEFRNQEQVTGLNIALEDLGDALVGAGTIAGADTYEIRQRSFTAEGRAVLDARTYTFKQEGHYRFCYPGLSLVCFEPERYSPGTCLHAESRFLSTTQVAGTSYWCEGNADAPQHLQLNYWQQ